MKNRAYSVAWLLIAATLWAPCAYATDVLAITMHKAQETITLSLPSNSPRKVFTVENPDRLVVDVPNIFGRPKVDLPTSYKGMLIKSVRYGQFNPDTSRFVFDLKQPVKLIRTEEGEKQGQLVLVIEPSQEAPTSIDDEDEKPAKMLKLPAKGSKKESKKDSKKEAKKAKPKKDEKPLIVIDAGHGGVDPGTIGPDDTEEKDIVLQYARALKAKLLKNGNYRVKLTREDDRFIMLRKRVEIARAAGGSIFISLHADSAPDLAARGLSIYTVSEQASDKEAEALAARENKSDVIAGMNLSEEREDVAGILISLAQRETKNRSAVLADELVIALEEQVKLLPNSHRFAGFAVLKAPDIPSVLIETGFLSNAKEEKLLKSKAYREKVIGGIALGIDEYFKRNPTDSQ